MRSRTVRFEVPAARRDREDTTLQDRVAQEVTDSILAGDLQPGDRVSPIQLAGRLAMSHIPVREALQALDGEGQITWIPRRGFYVTELSLGDIEDVYLWRDILETPAYGLAVAAIDEQDLLTLQELYELMKSAELAGDTVQFAKASRRFSLVPIEAIGSPRILRFLTYLWDVSALYYATMVSKGVIMPKMREDHGKLLTAFTNRNAESVVRLRSEHRRALLAIMRRTLGEWAGQG